MSLSGCADSLEGKDAFERSLREGNARDGEGGKHRLCDAAALAATIGKAKTPETMPGAITWRWSAWL